MYPPSTQSPDPWIIRTDTIDPAHYAGVSLPNGTSFDYADRASVSYPW